MYARGEGLINAPAEEIADLIFDIKKRGLFDDTFKSGHNIRNLSKTIILVYGRFKALFPVRDRDFVTCSCKMKGINNVFYLNSYSI